MDNRIILGHFITVIHTQYCSELLNLQENGTLVQYLRTIYIMPDGTEVPWNIRIWDYINTGYNLRVFPVNVSSNDTGMR